MTAPSVAMEQAAKLKAIKEAGDWEQQTLRVEFACPAPLFDRLNRLRVARNNAQNSRPEMHPPPCDLDELLVQALAQYLERAEGRKARP